MKKKLQKMYPNVSKKLQNGYILDTFATFFCELHVFCQELGATFFQSW